MKSMRAYHKLKAREKSLLFDFESGAFKAFRARNKELIRYRGYEKASLNQARNINIRLPERDLQKLKAKAAQKGLPYQTLVSSLLRQYTNE